MGKPDQWIKPVNVTGESCQNLPGPVPSEDVTKLMKQDLVDN